MLVNVWLHLILNSGLLIITGFAVKVTRFNFNHKGNWPQRLKGTKFNIAAKTLSHEFLSLRHKGTKFFINSETDFCVLVSSCLCDMKRAKRFVFMVKIKTALFEGGSFQVKIKH